MSLQGKVALVTGGGSGIGEAISRLFAENGAAVAVLDIDKEAAELVAASLDGAYALQTDVSDSAAVGAAVTEVEANLGPLDVLVNNAGIGGVAEAERIMPKAEAQMTEAAGAPRFRRDTLPAQPLCRSDSLGRSGEDDRHGSGSHRGGMT